eukprot:5748184-Pyramimonas_sp.AAC.1
MYCSKSKFVLNPRANRDQRGLSICKLALPCSREATQSRRPLSVCTVRRGRSGRSTAGWLAP